MFAGGRGRRSQLRTRATTPFFLRGLEEELLVEATTFYFEKSPPARSRLKQLPLAPRGHGEAEGPGGWGRLYVPGI